jgi:hypothetical protein
VKKIAVSAAVALTGSLVLAAPASADTVSGATLTWKVSECAFDPTIRSCGSLTEAQSVSGGATKESDGWRFVGGTGTYDPATGATDVRFPGGLTLGNTSRGNYAITFADPRITVANGAGSLFADVSYRVGLDAPTTTVPNVKIVDLPAVPKGTTWQSTPSWDPSTGQFAPELLTALPDAPIALDDWFRITPSGSSNPFKPASPVNANLGTVTPEAAMTPKVTIEGADNLPVTKATTITVKGTGFDPAAKSPAVQGLYVVFGPDAASVGYGLDKALVFKAAQFLPAAPDAQGTFTTTLTITGRYTDSDGKAWDGTRDTLGVSTWAAHSRATTAWDSFTPITFSPAVKAATTTKLRLTDKTLKVGQRAKAKVTVKGADGRVQIKKGKRVLATKKLNAQGKATLRLPKLKAGTHRVRAVYLGNAEAKRSVSAKVVLRVR